MATDKINNYAIGDNNFESVMLTLDQTFRNKHDCYSFSATALKAGSVIEINGSLYPVTQDMTLPNMTSNKYLMAVPSSSGTFSLLATSTAPTWSHAKQGYYGTSTTANYKYIAYTDKGFMYKYTSTGAIIPEAITTNFIDCRSANEKTISFSENDEFIVRCPLFVYGKNNEGLDPSPYMYVYFYGSYKATGIGLSSGNVSALMPGKYKIFANSATLVFGGAFGSVDINDAVVAL